MEREAMDTDLLIIGAGPAGLCAAIRAKQAANSAGIECNVCVLEKASEVGAHLLSGAVLDPIALYELLPNWQALDLPFETPVSHDEFLWLSKEKAHKLPTPPQMHNQGNFIISLGKLGRFLAEQAEALGVEIYPGFAASEVLFDEADRVIGVATGDMGITKEGEHKASFQRGMAIHARQTLFAEGCRGSLTKSLIEHYALDKDSQPQTYALGIKEIWQVKSDKHQTGKVTHTIGWPLDNATYGGSFIYHLPDNKVALGLVVGLDYQNPYLSPFEEMQRFKTHPAIAPLLAGGERLAYGARALNEGGYQSIPKLTFPGGALIGCSAGFVNVAKIKGNHTAMKSGMCAAEAFVASLAQESPSDELDAYPNALRQSYVYHELKSVRNIRPGFRRGLWFGLANAAFETYITRGHSPWTLSHHADHESLRYASECQPIDYPKPDGTLTFDRSSSVYLSNIYHEEDQPVHLTLKDISIPVEFNLAQYDAPEQRYCPAGVYEIVQNEHGKPALQINAQNCVHCKTCDIKDPKQNINWITPEGGSGPNYQEM